MAGGGEGLGWGRHQSWAERVGSLGLCPYRDPSGVGTGEPPPCSRQFVFAENGCEIVIFTAGGGKPPPYGLLMQCFRIGLTTQG